MTPTEFEGRLAELRRAPTNARRSMIVDELREALPFVGGAARESFVRTTASLGLPLLALPAPRLRVGEAWLLLFVPPRDGRVVRIHVRRGSRPAAGDELFDREVVRAHRAVLAALGRAYREPRGFDAYTNIEVAVAGGEFEIEGSSLGLSLAVASVSTMLERAPDPTWAASAEIFESGVLGPVEYLAEKVAALRAECPAVKRLVVARKQYVPADIPAGIEFVPCDSLEGALVHFGLELTGLPEASLERLESRVLSLDAENAQPHVAEEWRRLANEAWYLGRALSGDNPKSKPGARALLNAALFATHAGDPTAADAFVRDIPEELVIHYPSLRARKRIAAASLAIDVGDTVGAERLANEAVEAAGASSDEERAVLLGQAKGTLGRVHMHAGRPDRAEPMLRDAWAHHLEHQPNEGPRSACYLATCIRLAGRPAEAVALADDALEETKKRSRWALASTTSLYLLLERGRSLAALGLLGDARAALSLARAGQASPKAYPRLGATRSLVTVVRVAGDVVEARALLQECLVVASEAEAPPTLRRVAAIAAGEWLVSDPDDAEDVEALRSAWRLAFGDVASPEDIARTCASWVY